ncbi:MAG: hypothetical protein DDT42_01913 [candidate division WS2 bacterium]|uniref:Uncharacterized protein n=1 Tax=Psychracetigena formicireducens TaxID=2986056 RepID=A0A9E2BN54_PSYF1|nr:hypothetical protein [Candidatus Psychracetigena formicireducens]
MSKESRNNVTKNQLCVVEKHMDGAIILNSFIQGKLLKKIQSANYPIVVMDRILDLPHVTSVVPDNEIGGAMAVGHLISSGCKKNRDSLLGARKAMKTMLV